MTFVLRNDRTHLNRCNELLPRFGRRTATSYHYQRSNIVVVDGRGLRMGKPGIWWLRAVPLSPAGVSGGRGENFIYSRCDDYAFSVFSACLVCHALYVSSINTNDEPSISIVT
jgi:hypothetical protein